MIASLVLFAGIQVLSEETYLQLLITMLIIFDQTFVQRLEKCYTSVSTAREVNAGMHSQ